MFHSLGFINRRLFCLSLTLLAIGLIGGCPARPQVKFLALGDSYTIGQSVPESDRWPVQLVAALKHDGPDVGPPQIIARTGWTTADLLDALDHADLQKRYGWVTLMIGVNDQFQRLPIEEFRMRLDKLLERSIALSGDPKHVIAISIPDWSVTPFAAGQDRAAIAKEIDAFNKIYAEEVSEKTVAFVDVTEISRVAADDLSLIADDGLHPSGKMYAKWVAAITGAFAR